ncbi:MAG: chorismate mutase [Putridiphycobacter sp.]|nr:chorismate mutase [Putridiphycobacter sp.]
MFSNLHKPFIIAGPCSAESPEQLNTVAKTLSQSSNIKLLRAGIWKPRTRPNNFEGVGDVGLKWLVDAGKSYRLKTTTEVANALHVEQALKAGVDVLWIGARTTVNPFSVQEIADAIKGSNVPVLIKNPITPDLDLWVGAIERVLGAGISDVAAIHRGFSSYEKTKFRNVPKWGIPVGLMQIFPELPIICDPSHIGGNRQLIQEISQKAMDMNMVGLMVETHPDPDKALSDAAQQITPSHLLEIIKNITVRQKTPGRGKDYTLDDLRDKIDEVDSELLTALFKRFAIIDEIGTYKKEHNLTILQIERWTEILTTRTEKGMANGLTKEFIDAILKAIHKESVLRQTHILNSPID